MKINALFDERVLVHSADMHWQESPMAGVSRRPLDRVGGEVARATSIVRYAPGSHFSAHIHTGGEEFLVLEGIFQDEHGDFPAGSYQRNPPQSRHTPRSDKGCVIFVKLWQFELSDSTQVRLNSNDINPSADPNQRGVWITSLYVNSSEAVSIQTWKEDTEICLDASSGIEVLVLVGSFTEAGETLKKHSWLRLPIGSKLKAKTGNQGAKVWVKQHHLSRVSQEISQIESLSG